jgi:hypothetical protein
MRKGFVSSGERFQIMVGSLPQGEIGMLIAAYLFSRGLVNPAQFDVAIIAVVVLTMITPVLMKMVFSVPRVQTNHVGRILAESKK